MRNPSVVVSLPSAHLQPHRSIFTPCSRRVYRQTTTPLEWSSISNYLTLKAPTPPPSHPPDEIPRWCLFKSDSSFLPTVAEFVSCSVRRLNMQSVDGVLSERKTTFSFVAVSVDLCCPMVQRMQHVGANLSGSLMDAMLHRYRQILRLG